MTRSYAGDDNLYHVLRLTPAATRDDVRRSYLALVRLHHPDKLPRSPSPSPRPSTVAPSEPNGGQHHAPQADDGDGDGDGRRPAQLDIRTLNLAYEVLMHPDKRAEYDDALRQRQTKEHLASPSTTTPALRVAQTLDLSHFEPHSPPRASVVDAEEADRGTTYTHPCRCGAEYVISDADMEQGVDVVACSGCSERVRVEYEEVEDEVEDEDVEAVGLRVQVG